MLSAVGHDAHDVLPVPVAYVAPVHDAHADATLLPVLALYVPALHAVRPPVVICDELCVPP